MQDMILILDFGSQYTQLIARRVRELNVYSEIHPWDKCPEITSNIKGVILSGSPFSVRDEKSPKIDLSKIKGKVPLLGVCFGAQYMAHNFGGEVAASPPKLCAIYWAPKHTPKSGTLPLIFDKSIFGDFSSLTENGLPDRITPLILLVISGHLSHG